MWYRCCLLYGFFLCLGYFICFIEEQNLNNMCSLIYRCMRRPTLWSGRNQEMRQAAVHPYLVETSSLSW